MALTVIESIIIRKVENVFSKELSRLSKDMACPIMLVRRYVRTCCENNDMMGMLNESVWKNVCNFLYEKYVKWHLTTKFNLCYSKENGGRQNDIKRFFGSIKF